MSYIVINKQKFKLFRTTLLLFLFQSFGALLMGFLYTLTIKLAKIAPLSTTGNSLMSIIGLLIASFYFGQWVEKRRPGILNRKRINQLSFLSILIQSAVGLSYFIYNPIDSQELLEDMFGLSVFVSVILLLFVIISLSTKCFIALGVKKAQRTITSK